MNKNEYLKKLDALLEPLPYDERRDIMYDYEEHFRASMEDGKTEEEIIASLGSPEKIASQCITSLIPYKEEKPKEGPKEEPKKQDPRPSSYDTKKNTDVGRILVVGSLMVFFNLIFIGFYISIWAVLITFAIVSVIPLILGFITFIAAVFSVPVAVALPVGFINYPIFGGLSAIALISVGALMLIGSIFLIKYYGIFTIKYAKWNIKVVRGW